MSTARPLDRFRLRRAVGRDPGDNRSASPLELLYDLTLVVAFSQAADQLTKYLAAEHFATALAAFSFIIISICWAWISYSWFASAFDTDDWLHRVLTMVQMVGVLILALGIPEVFSSIDAGQGVDFRIVAVGYVIMRVSMIFMWLRVARVDPANRRTALLYVVFTAGAQVGWVILAWVEPADLVLLSALIVILWAIELCGPIVSTWDSSATGDSWHGTPWNAEHIADRYGLLVIITLGEALLGTIAAVAALVARVGWSVEAVLIVIAGVGLTFGLWWTYFIFPSATVLARHRHRKWAWSYGHIALFGAIVAVGAGLHLAAYSAEGATSLGTLGIVLAVAVPVLVFCLVYFILWSVLFRAVDPFHVMLALGMVAFLVLAVLCAWAGLSLGWCLIIVMLSPAVVAVGYETGGYRHVEADVSREGEAQQQRMA